MGLKIDFVTKYGVTANYHKLVSTTSDHPIEIAVYYNKEARDSGKSHMDVIRIYDEVPLGTFSESSLKATGKSYKVIAYEFLKTLPAYENAIDVLE